VIAVCAQGFGIEWTDH